MAKAATFNIRRSTIGRRHSTFDSRQSDVGCIPVDGCRMSNVVSWKGRATTQEDAGTTQEGVYATQEIAATTQEAPNTPQEAAATPQENALGATDLVLALINEKPEISLVEIAEKLGISRDGVKYHIDRLKQSVGLIHDGPTKKGRWIVTNP